MVDPGRTLDSAFEGGGPVGFGTLPASDTGMSAMKTCPGARYAEDAM